MLTAAPMWRNGRRNGLKIQKRAISSRSIRLLFTALITYENPALEGNCVDQRSVTRRRREVEQKVEQKFSALFYE